MRHRHGVRGVRVMITATGRTAENVTSVTSDNNGWSGRASGLIGKIRVASDGAPSVAHGWGARGEGEQYYRRPFGSSSDRRDKQPDPNSPFAKLAALKQQLEQDSKEPT